MLQQQQRRATARRHGYRMVWVILAGLLVSSVSAWAQEQTLTVQVAGLTADGWPQAQAVVTVLGDDGRPVADLEDANFAVQLDGSAVPVVAVTQAVDSSLAVDVVLAMDVSGSMGGEVLEQARMAARSFLLGLAPQDRIAIVTFHDTVDLILPFTQDRVAANMAIDSLAAGGGTALYQATAESIHLAATADSSRRAVVLLSDGVDNGSALTRLDALAPTETLGVPVFTIGLGAGIDRAYLEELARVSGGRSAETPSAEGLAQLYQEAAEVLRGQYILSLDTSELALDQSEAITLRVEAAVAEARGSDERVVCAQQLCVTLSGVDEGERLEEGRTLEAQVISADPVVSVTFLIDGEPTLELADPPYELTLDLDSLAGDEHTVAVEVVTLSGETQAREVGIRTGAAAGGMSSYVPVAGIAVIAVLGAALLVLIVRRRRRAGQLDAPGEPPPPEPETEPETEAVPEPRAEKGPSRPLWEEETPQPVGAPERVLGRLHVTGGPLAGQTFPVGATPVSIGSGHRCLVQLAQESEGGQEIGAEHARVWIRDGQLVIHELRRLSALGPMGGRWAFLAPGEVFTVGHCSFRFELAAEEGAEPMSHEGSGEVPDILRSHDHAEDEGGEHADSGEREVASPPEAEHGEEPGPAAPVDSDDSTRATPWFPGQSRPQPGD